VHFGCRNYDLVVASGGSFGSSFGFVSVDHELISIIQSECPSCAAPGNDVVEHCFGLPCDEYCHQPTKAIKSDKYQCSKCHFESVVDFPKGKKFEYPMYCDFCNP